MVKVHNVRVEITNKTPFNMTYSTDWYNSGRLADTYSWPQTIGSGRTADVLNYERDWSLAGCSGFVTYVVDGTDITIAFSNPLFGTNKLGVGIEGKGVWDSMGCQDYRPFRYFVETKQSSATLLFYLRCTSGSTNVCSVIMEAKTGNESAVCQPGGSH